MFLAFKIIGSLCAVAIPTGVCGTQAFLSKKHQTDHKKKIEDEFNKTQTSLSEAHQNYKTQINRIQSEKNALATTKQELTYNPVDIQSKITELNNSKSSYESHHTSLQKQITSVISTHNTNLDNKKKEIEGLWTTEKSRVEGINTKLENSINTAKSDNKNLRSNIQTLKDQIDKTINNVFNPPAIP